MSKLIVGQDIHFFCELISGRTKSDCAAEDWNRLNFSVLLNSPAQSEVVRGALIVRGKFRLSLWVTLKQFVGLIDIVGWRQ